MLPLEHPDRIHVAFDDHRLVANAGLLLPVTLAHHLGLGELVDCHVDLGDAPGRANAGDQMLTLVASALAGGDCIDDADALRAGGTARVLGCVVKAPSTLGTFLRSFRWGHARQLDRVSRELLARAWAAGAGPGDGPLTIDLDSTLCETYGLCKEGARHHGYTGQRGYHPILAVAAGTGDVLMARLREGRANTARGAAHFLRETVGRVRHAGATGPLTLGALELVEQSEASTGSVVQEAMGDAADGDGGTRQTFADAGRQLVAKVPGRPNRSHFPKDDFHLDLAAGSCTCPAGQVTHAMVSAGKRTDAAGRVYRLQAFQFDGAVCRACPLRSQCIAAKGRPGRRVLIHPQEALLQEARALQQSAAYDEYRARRVLVEHRLARLVQLGIRQSRYFGRVKTRFQVYLAATVANLTLVLGNIGLSGGTSGGAAGHRVVLNDVHAVVANTAANLGAVRLGQLWSVILLTTALLPQLHFRIRAFRPGF